jgi:hypothetical protein
VEGKHDVYEEGATLWGTWPARERVPCLTRSG